VPQISNAGIANALLQLLGDLFPLGFRDSRATHASISFSYAFH